MKFNNTVVTQTYRLIHPRSYFASRTAADEFATKYDMMISYDNATRDLFIIYHQCLSEEDRTTTHLQMERKRKEDLKALMKILDQLFGQTEQD